MNELLMPPVIPELNGKPRLMVGILCPGGRGNIVHPLSNTCGGVTKSEADRSNYFIFERDPCRPLTKQETEDYWNDNPEAPNAR